MLLLPALEVHFSLKIARRVLSQVGWRGGFALLIFERVTGLNGAPLNSVMQKIGWLQSHPALNIRTIINTWLIKHSAVNVNNLSARMGNTDTYMQGSRRVWLLSGRWARCGQADTLKRPYQLLISSYKIGKSVSVMFQAKLRDVFWFFAYHLVWKTCPHCVAERLVQSSSMQMGQIGAS